MCSFPKSTNVRRAQGKSKLHSSDDYAEYSRMIKASMAS